MSNFLEISQRYTLHLFFIFPFCWLFLGIAEITVSSGGESGGSGRRALFVMLMVGIKDFKMPRRRRQRERKKGNRLNSKTVTLHVRHAFSCISLPLLHDYYGKIPSFIFYGGRKQATAKFSFSFLTWVWFLGIRLKRVRLHLQMSWSKRERDWNNANSLFKRRFSGRHRRGVLYFLLCTRVSGTS